MVWLVEGITTTPLVLDGHLKSIPTWEKQNDTLLQSNHGDWLQFSMVVSVDGIHENKRCLCLSFSQCVLSKQHTKNERETRGGGVYICVDVKCARNVWNYDMIELEREELLEMHWFFLLLTIYRICLSKTKRGQIFYLSFFIVFIDWFFFVLN